MQPVSPDGANTSGSGFHEFLGMQFTPQQWQQFIQIVCQSVSTQIKHDQQTWKETMERNKRMIEGEE
jgi:hypothetical protein